jgi:hypothetical protein
LEAKDSKKDKKDKKENKDKKRKEREEAERIAASSAGSSAQIQPDQFRLLMDAIGTSAKATQGCVQELTTEVRQFKKETGERFEKADKSFSGIRTELDEQAKAIKELQEQREKDKKEAEVSASNPYSGGNPMQFVPINKRNIIFVGNFPARTERDDIVTKLNEMCAPYKDDVLDCFTTRKLTNFGKIKFKNSDAMWKYIKGTKAVKWTFEDKDLISSIDKTTDEVSLSKRVSKAVRLLKAKAEEVGIPKEDIKKHVDADWNIGTIMVKENITLKYKVVFEKPKGQERLIVAEGASNPWGLVLADIIDDINQIEK